MLIAQLLYAHDDHGEHEALVTRNTVYQMCQAITSDLPPTPTASLEQLDPGSGELINVYRR